VRYNSSKKLKVSAIIQARMGSTRLPGKVLMKILDKPVLLHIIERLKYSKLIDDIIIATSNKDSDLPIINFAIKNKEKYFCGSEENVLERVYQCAIENRSDIVVEICGDCPLIDYRFVDLCINNFFKFDYHLVTNALSKTYPNGLETNVLTTKLLGRINKKKLNKHYREHLCSYILQNPSNFKIKSISANKKFTQPAIKLTLDTKKDFKFIENLYTYISPNKKIILTEDIIKYLNL